jgi:hypothetical protein
LTAEGVVLGADSTVTVSGGDEPRYYNHAQKLFQVGDPGTLGIAMWGDIPRSVSYRTMIAHFADSIRTKPPTSVEDVAKRWAAHAHGELRKAYTDKVTLADAAAKKEAAGATPTDEEKSAVAFVADFSTGFCVGGCSLPERRPAAYELEVALSSATAPAVEELAPGDLHFWGAPNILQRVLHSIDYRIIDDILDAKNANGSKAWTGSDKDLFRLAFSRQLFVNPGIPIREAVDLVHFSIQATIKALKFSHFSPTCGGPIEVAVVTSDRPFRWVRHKSFDAAI